MSGQLKIRGIKFLGNDTYSIRVRARSPLTGEMENAKKKVRGTLTDAIRVRDELKALLKQGKRDERKERLHVEDYARWWLTTKLPELKSSTRRKYATVLDKYVLPKLGKYYLDVLTPPIVADWVKGMTDEGYAGWTVTNALRLVRTMTRDAMVHHPQLVKAWPCERVRPPRVNLLVGENRNLLSADELASVLETIRLEEPYWYALTVTAAFTGLRWGELTALRWEDLDQDAGVIRVRRNNYRGQIDTTKTGREREVPLMPKVAAVLEQHKAWLSERKTVRWGGGRSGRKPSRQYEGFLAGWVFPSKRGGLHRGWQLSKVLAAALTGCNIERKLTGHGLRRTFNDLLRRVATGEVVRSITGHSTTAMTFHYSHVDAAEKLVAAERLLQLVQPKKDEQAAPSAPAEEVAPSSGTCGISADCQAGDSRAISEGADRI